MVQLWGKAVSRNPENGVIRHLIGCARSGQRRSLSGIQMPVELARRITPRVVSGKRRRAMQQATTRLGIADETVLGMTSNRRKSPLLSWVEQDLVIVGR
jgi:hypothetical protein